MASKSSGCECHVTDGDKGGKRETMGTLEDTAQGIEEKERGGGKNSQEQAGEDVALALIFILCALLAAVAPFLALPVRLQVCCSTKTTPSRHASRLGDSGIPDWCAIVLVSFALIAL